MKVSRTSFSVLPSAWAWAAIRWAKDGESTVPGQIALQRIFCFRKSAATDLVRPTTAALVTLYTNRFGTPFTDPATEDTLIMEAPPRIIIPGRKALISRN